MLISESTLIHEFDAFNIKIDSQPLIDMIIALCYKYEILEQRFASEWLAYALNNNFNDKIDESLIIKFEKEILCRIKKRVQKPKKQASPNKISQNLNYKEVKSSTPNSTYKKNEKLFNFNFKKRLLLDESLLHTNFPPKDIAFTQLLNIRTFDENSTLKISNTQFKPMNCFGTLRYMYQNSRDVLYEQTMFIDRIGAEIVDNINNEINEAIGDKQNDKDDLINPEPLEESIDLPLQTKPSPYNPQGEPMLYYGQIINNYSNSDFRHENYINNFNELFYYHHHTENGGVIDNEPKKPLQNLNPKLTPETVILRCTHSISNGSFVKLNLSKLSDYTLFPGQIVGVRGYLQKSTNSKYSDNIAQKRMPVLNVESIIYPSVAPKRILEKVKENSVDNINEMSIVHSNILVICGPFALNEQTLQMANLDVIQKMLCEYKPNLCVLIGPFMDQRNPLFKNFPFNMSEEIFTEVETYLSNDQRSTHNTLEAFNKSQIVEWIFVNGFLKALVNMIHSNNLDVRFAIMATSKDVFNPFCIYPTPEFNLSPTAYEKMPEISFIPDPCVLEINGCTIGLTSMDTLFQMSSEEICKDSSDRMGRLARHIVGQKSFYPLYFASNPDTHIDYGLFYKYAVWNHCPDILVFPSDLKHFIKEIEEAVYVVNPGRFSKTSNGTFLHMCVAKNENTAEKILCNLSIFKY